MTFFYIGHNRAVVRSIVLAASVATLSVGCSGKKEAPQQLKYIEADGYFESADGKKNHSLLISGEYANFSRECAKDSNEMGPIGYAREVIDYGVVPAKIPNQIVRKGCNLSLVGINLSGEGISGGVATAPNRFSGTEKQSCYQFEREEKTCLSSKAPRLANHPFLGTMISNWEEIK